MTPRTAIPDPDEVTNMGSLMGALGGGNNKPMGK